MRFLYHFDIFLNIFIHVCYLYVADLIMAFREFEVNHKKYADELHSPHSNRRPEKRGPLRLLPVFRQFKFSDKTIQHLKMTAAGRGKGCQDQHNRTLTKLQAFCVQHKTSILKLKPAILEDYIAKLDSTEAKFSACVGLHGAVSYLHTALRIPDPWTPSVHRLYEALIRRAAAEKPIVRKAPQLHIRVLQMAIEEYIWPNAANPELVSFFPISFIFFSLFSLFYFSPLFLPLIFSLISIFNHIINLIFIWFPFLCCIQTFYFDLIFHFLELQTKFILLFFRFLFLPGEL